MKLRLFNPPSRHPEPIPGPGLVLRSPEPGHYAAWRELRLQSMDFLKPWEPRWPADDLTRTGYRRRLARYQSDAAERSGYTYFLFDRDTGELLGGLSLSNIRLGAARSCALGYWMGEKHAGRGFMKKAVAMVLPYAFGAMGLERIEAGCIPDNTRSIRLLEGLGFRREGIMRGYLEIDGVRRDHVLYAMLRCDFAEADAGKTSPIIAGIGA